MALRNPWYASWIAINRAYMERSGASARLTLALTRFPDDGSANFFTLVTFQRKTYFTFHRRNGGAELAHSGKWGPLMTSSYSVNRDKTFWSSLGRGYAGHPRIHSWNYGMTGITENTKGCSWYTTLKTLKAGKTKLETHKLSDSKLASSPTFLVLLLLFEAPWKQSRLLTHCICRWALWKQSTCTLQLLLMAIWKQNTYTLQLLLGDLQKRVLTYYSGC